ncbi:CCA tRNA nucleotidyltransferase [Asaia sp. W19]|uniref:CCA tRNA nucleotidyltransferase n=1 Tax=unclassified Asaia TaxID=2685023 RepID=UPI000F8C9FA5|nr:CCA tRNA nucleotidyltransferase [Asaia sp. W19]RUT27121.1 CCA tRNA nucleotidyltransferase [Asaia sp. W19]
MPLTDFSTGSAVTLLDQLPQRSGLDRLWRFLPEARLVGGSVRDLLLGGQQVHDLDLATPEPPHEVQAVLARAGIKTIPTGLAHGTITALIDQVPYEITTLRRDVTTNGRHAEVAWTTNWQEDAARRDFTINALFCDRWGVIHDFFGGQRDLAARHVRFVGEAGRRIEEDALRILRFFRFDARFGSDRPDLAAMTAIRSHAGMIGGLSAERLASEMVRILTGPHLARCLAHMEAADVLDRVVASPRTRRLVRGLKLGAPEDGVLRLGLLSDAPDLAQRLRLSGKQAQRLSLMRGPYLSDETDILSPQCDDDALRRQLALEEHQTLLDRIWLLQTQDDESLPEDWDALRTRLIGMKRPIFPLAGRDAVKAGLGPGPEVGLVLAELQDWWRARGCLPDREACLAELKNRLPLSPQG